MIRSSVISGVRIHPTAVVDPALVASPCEIGPDCQIHMGAIVVYRSRLNGSQAAAHLRTLPADDEIAACLMSIETSVRGRCAGRRRGKPSIGRRLQGKRL